MIRQIDATHGDCQQHARARIHQGDRCALRRDDRRGALPAPKPAPMPAPAAAPPDSLAAAGHVSPPVVYPVNPPCSSPRGDPHQTPPPPAPSGSPVNRVAVRRWPKPTLTPPSPPPPTTVSAAASANFAVADPKCQEWPADPDQSVKIDALLSDRRDAGARSSRRPTSQSPKIRPPIRPASSHGRTEGTRRPEGITAPSGRWAELSERAAGA